MEESEFVHTFCIAKTDRLDCVYWPDVIIETKDALTESDGVIPTRKYEGQVAVKQSNTR